MNWSLIIKIAIGGFGTVFIILVVLWLSIYMTKLLVDKIVEEKNNNKIL